jgi:hypothetical protein
MWRTHIRDVRPGAEGPPSSVDVHQHLLTSGSNDGVENGCGHAVNGVVDFVESWLIPVTIGSR